MLSSLFSIKRAWLLAIAFAFAAPAVYAQTDPTNQINWPLTTITGSDTPSQACTAGNYGQPFQRTDVTPNKFGTCGADDWQYRGSGSGSGGVGAHTYSSCPAATGSSSELMVMTVGSTCAMPLPAIVAGYNVAVQTSTSSTVSIAPPGGVTLYVAGVSASSLTIPNGQTVFVTTDGTSYYSTAPAVAGSGITITPGATGNIYTATGSGIGLPSCSDTSGSGTAQACSTSPTFTPAANQNCILYHTTTANSGTGLTVNVNSLGAKPVAIAGSSGWTTTLTAGLLTSSKPLAMCYDGTNWDVLQTGTAASSGGGGSSRVVYVSQLSGIHQNSNVQSGGGTTDSAVIQTALTALGTAGGGTLVQDGASLIDATNANGTTQWSALAIPPNVTILCPSQNQGFYLANSSNVAMLSNKNITGNPAATFDTNMSTRGCTWNGNGSNQSRYEQGNSANNWVFGFFFSGFDGWTVDNTVLLNVKTFADTYANGKNFVVRDTTCTWNAGGGQSSAPTTAVNNHDCLHFWGPLTNGYVHNVLDHWGDDDGLAINTNEQVFVYYANTYWGGSRFPWAGATPGVTAPSGAINITNVYVDGFNFDSTATGVRWFSKSGTNWGTSTGSVSNITLTNLTGTITVRSMDNGCSDSQPNCHALTSPGPITIDKWYVSGSFNALNIPTSSSLMLSDILTGATINTNSATAAQQFPSGATFAALGGGTNTSAAMAVGSGASLAPTGTGTIQATNIGGTVAAGSGASVTGAGTVASPYTIALSSGTSGGGLFPSATATVPTTSNTGLTTAFSQTGTFSATNGGNGILLADTANTGSGDHVEGIVKAYPGTAFTMTALVSLPFTRSATDPVAGQGPWIGFIVANGTTSSDKFQTYAFDTRSGVGYEIGYYNWTNATTFNSTIQSSTTFSVLPPFMWLRWKDDGTNVTFSISTDGQYFRTLYGPTAKSSSYLGSSGYNYIGLGLDPFGNVFGSTILGYTYTTP